MRLVTIVSLAASAVLGLGALFVAKIALPSAHAAKLTAGPAPVVGTPLVVASRAIKYGEKLEPGMLKVIKVPGDAIPEGAYTAVAQAMAADKGGAPVVLTPISAHEAILPTKLSGPGARPSVAAEVTEGMRAYALKVNDATGVGGHALPGDHVDVVLLRDLTPNGDQRSYISYVVVQNARVLGLDLNADPTSNKPASPNTYTVEVSVADSQKLSVAATLGTLSLALRGSGAAELAKAPPMRTNDFLSGGGGGGGARGPVRAGPSRPAYSGIMIVEGSPVKREPKQAKGAVAAAKPSLGSAADVAG